MNIQKNISLKPFNTFGLDIKASSFLEVETISELQEVLTNPPANPILIMGGGSNVLFRQDFDGLVIRNCIRGINITKDDGDHVLVEIGAGEVWHDLVLWALDEGLGGIENLSLIPGTVGAAPMQNIGAYGVELESVFDHLIAVSRTDGSLCRFNHKDCEFGYRSSVFKTTLKNEYVIATVTLRLTREHVVNTSYGAIQDTLKEMGIANPGIREVSDAVISIRRSKLPDPAEIGNSGSFFKNPVIDKVDFEGLKAEYPEIPGYEAGHGKTKVPAGWLIEHSGLKGIREGDAGTHKKQALVLVNYGNASGEELWNMALKIQDTVSKKFGIILEPEVNVI